jgi:hypothetical protein
MNSLYSRDYDYDMYIEQLDFEDYHEEVEMTDFELGMRRALVLIGCEIECCDNGCTPFLTVKLLKKDRKDSQLTTNQLLKRVQKQITRLVKYSIL